ncbi:transcriptional regulator with XRE-family HTH domain [Paenibacillus sp. SORGH_AS306]|uniref:DNA-binding protein n=1 Tax=Paenibacillus kyungheensis TaxID=1452732 RepID=A0AAX3M0P4_9BACL|nr:MULTISPECIES: DNA-binding protein [Paenibacillus]MDQ1236045.1 transcriptional regulator with XRE-family HTH domain [Paenibacillus sp. SORGH_AS_0306]MDR6108401.1 transcriptional regulator with XRE-family HTH domain [Paenibacillus sp. SORGH_AS_0338]WCT55523.1 DNA-binding protein [Paenibacillus kyungheensis]
MITNTTTIRLEIEKGIRQKGHSLSSFGKQAGINRGIISGILNGNPPKSISIRQLDLMAEALGHAEGWMYEYYVDECFINEKADWRRIKAFLLRCTEIGRYDCIQEVLDRLMEDLNNTISIFGLAEELYAEGKVQESLPFYECVIENEKHQHSERLAIAHYRVFRASIGDNTEKNFRAAIRFETFRDRLPENFMLDGLLALSNIYYVLQDWNIVEKCADELISIIQTIYKNEEKKMEESNNYTALDTERPLVFYYGQSYLIKGVALEHKGKYEESKTYIHKYMDLSWFKGLDDAGQEEIKRLSHYATANMYLVEVLMGNTDVLPAYVNFLEKHPAEILPAMFIILKAANMHGFDVDNLLVKFESFLEYDESSENHYSKVAVINRYVNFHYQLAIYSAKKNLYSDCISNLLKSLNLAIKISSKNKILDVIAFIEQIKTFASETQLFEYESLLKGVGTDEKIYDFANFISRAN